MASKEETSNWKKKKKKDGKKSLFDYEYDAVLVSDAPFNKQSFLRASFL